MRHSGELAPNEHLHVCREAPQGYNEHAGRIIGVDTPFQHCIVNTADGLKLLRFAPHGQSVLSIGARDTSIHFLTPRIAAYIHDRHLTALKSEAGIDHLNTNIVGVVDSAKNSRLGAGHYYASDLLPEDAVNLAATTISGEPQYEAYGHYADWALSQSENFVMSDAGKRNQHHVYATTDGSYAYQLHDPEPIFDYADSSDIYDRVRGTRSDWDPNTQLDLALGNTAIELDEPY